MLQHYNYEQYNNSNEFVSIFTTDIVSGEKFCTSIKAKVVNNTNQILNIAFTECYFITHDKTQHELFYSALIRNNPEDYKLTILPNVGMGISYNLSVLFDKNHKFHKNDLVISTFVIDNKKHVVGFRMGEVADIYNSKTFTKSIPETLITKKEKPRLSGCSLAFVIVTLAFFLMILIFGFLAREN